VILVESLATQSLLLIMHRGNIDTCPLPGRFVISLMDWNLIIALMVKMWIFNYLAISLQALFYVVMLNNLLMDIRTVFFGFYLCGGWLGEFGLCVSWGNTKAKWMTKGIWPLSFMRKHKAQIPLIIHHNEFHCEISKMRLKLLWNKKS